MEVSNRIIKFRAWHKDYKVMEYQVSIYNGMYLEIIGNDIWGTSEDYILMQYTGLKDANGKEIYEGDIVKYFDWSTEPSFTEVKWQDDTSGFYPFADSPKNCGCCGEGLLAEGIEVVGNIYENPELLGEKINE